MPKGQYDRAASRWTPPPRAAYPPELVAEVRRLYDGGMSMREVAVAAGTTVKVLQRLMPRHGIARRSTAKRDQRGAANSSWRGGDAAYAALHMRVEAARGKPAACSRCDATGGRRRYEWANLTGDYENVHDYARMCASCHRSYDAARRRLTGQRTVPAHLAR